MTRLNTSFYTISGLMRKLNKVKSCLENEVEGIIKFMECSKAVLGGKFIAIQAYNVKQEKFQILLTLHLGELKKNKQNLKKLRSEQK